MTRAPPSPPAPALRPPRRQEARDTPAATGSSRNHAATALDRKAELGRKTAGGRVMAGRSFWWVNAALALLLVILAVVSLMVGPAGLSWRAALHGLFSGDGAAGVIVRDIRLPRTLLALLIGATLGLSGAALQGLLRNPLAEPALFGAPQAAAAAAALVIAFGFAPVTSFAVPVAAILGAVVSIAALVAVAGRRASLTVTLLAGLALASFAGAMTALILNLAPNPFAALEIAFWLLGSLEDRSTDHLLIAAPFLVMSWLLLAMNARAFRALTLGEDAAASLGVDLARVRMTVVVGVAIGVGAAVAVAGSIGF